MYGYYFNGVGGSPNSGPAAQSLNNAAVGSTDGGLAQFNNMFWETADIARDAWVADEFGTAQPPAPRAAAPATAAPTKEGNTGILIAGAVGVALAAFLMSR